MMSNRGDEAGFTVNYNPKNIKTWVVGDLGGGNPNIKVSELKKGQTLQGDALVIDTDGDGKLSVKDYVLRAPNISATSVRINSDKTIEFNSLGLGAVLGMATGNQPREMTLQKLAEDLSGSKKGTTNFNRYNFGGMPFKSLFR